MSLDPLLEKKAIRRGVILKILNKSPPFKWTDKEILFELNAAYSQFKIADINEVRDVLKYLHGHNLCSLNSHEFSEEKTWVATITSFGVDYLDGLVDLLKGVKNV